MLSVSPLSRPDCHRKMIVGAPIVSLSGEGGRIGVGTIAEVSKGFLRHVPTPFFYEVTLNEMSKDFGDHVTSPCPVFNAS